MLESKVIGVKKAAIRRLNYELGIDSSQICENDLHFVTRILYFSPCDDTWAEYERISFIKTLFCFFALFLDACFL